MMFKPVTAFAGAKLCSRLVAYLPDINDPHAVGQRQAKLGGLCKTNRRLCNDSALRGVSVREGHASPRQPGTQDTTLIFVVSKLSFWQPPRIIRPERPRMRSNCDNATIHPDGWNRDVILDMRLEWFWP